MKETPSTIEEVADRVIALHDSDYPLYIIKGQKNFLVDSGTLPRASDFRKRFRTALGEDKIHTLLLTHSHYDHVGCAAYLQNIYNFDVKCSTIAAGLLQNPDIVEMIDLRNQDAKEKVGDYSNSRFETLHNLSGVADGSRIEVDDSRYFEVISVPGHSDCAVAYLLQPDRILFAGDAAGMKDRNGYIWPVFFSHQGNYEKSLSKLNEIQAEALACGHSEIILGKESVSDYFKEAHLENRRMKMEILGKIHRGMEQFDIADEIKEKRFIPNSVLGSEDFLLNVLALVRAVGNELNSSG